MEVKIEKNIPLPKQRVRKYPFENMKVGDSFYSEVAPSSLLTCAKHFCKKYYPNWNFTVRKINKGARIWRTK
jgi:hypothetical protein